MISLETPLSVNVPVTSACRGVPGGLDVFEFLGFKRDFRVLRCIEPFVTQHVLFLHRVRSMSDTVVTMILPFVAPGFSGST